MLEACLGLLGALVVAFMGFIYRLGKLEGQMKAINHELKRLNEEVDEVRKLVELIKLR